MDYYKYDLNVPSLRDKFTAQGQKMDGRNKVEVWKTGEIIMNSVNLTGRVTKDIELSTTKSGQSVASFNLAVMTIGIKMATK